jgi:4-hydroxy-tetrahydrodipicolinate synthase
MAFGGRGVISTVANIAPSRCTTSVRHFCAESGQSRELQLALNPLADAMFCDVNPVPVKTALRLMGYDVGALRAPLCDLRPRCRRIWNR